MTSIRTSAHAGRDGGLDGLRRVDGHRDPRPAAHQGAEPGGVDHLVGQQQVVAQAGRGHPLHLPDGGAGEGRGGPRRAWRRASAVHLCALTWGRSRGPGRAAGHGGEIVLEQAPVDDQSGRGQLPGPHAGQRSQTGTGPQATGHDPRGPMRVVPGTQVATGVTIEEECANSCWTAWLRPVALGLAAILAGPSS